MNAEALQKLLMLVRLLQKSAESASEVAAVVQGAQDDGRDLSDEEIDLVRQRTDEAIDELRSLE